LFKRAHHLRIANVLQALDSKLLRKHRCFFGGGTAIVLLRDEYRESVDIDFLTSDKKGFRELRELLTSGHGLSPILRPGTKLSLAREIRADQYGIRTMVLVGDVQIKFEIVLEGRIQLEVATEMDQICGLTTLTTLDFATTKILANSDRWTDDSAYSRDLIDLAMLQAPPTQFQSAIAKGKEAYGDAAVRDLGKAIEKLKQRPGRLDECLTALKIQSIPPAVLWSRIRSLI
jgi:hypothetical protein